MQYVNLLGRFRGEEGLEAFAEKFFSSLKISDFEERESRNYVDGRYFRGADGLTVFTLALSDEVTNRDLPYWVQVTSDDGTSSSLEYFVDDLIRGKLIAMGFDFAKIINFGKRTETRVDY